MKAKSTLRLICLFALSLISSAVLAQGPQTIIQVNIAPTRTEGAILYLPDDYATSTTRYPIIVFLHGIGEGGTNPATIYNSASAGGPAYFIAHGQWPSSTINPSDGLPYKFIVVSPQNNEGWSTTAPELDYVLTYMINKYRVDTTRLYLTGLSAGGEGITEYVAKRQGSGTFLNLSHQIAAFVPMSAVVNGGQLINIADTVAADNVRMWGFGSPTDTHGANTLRIVGYVNQVIPGFAVSTSYTGGHCCWGQFYNPTFTQSIGGQTMNIYQWMLMYKRTYAAPGPVPPTVGAGSAQTIMLPTSNATLTGTATGNAGATISSVSWTQVSGPNAAVIVSANNLSTAITGLISGSYTFSLSATDNNGMTGSSTVTIRVDAKPVSNAGTNQTITLPTNTVTLNGSASSDPDGTISTYSWTKVSGPATGTIAAASSVTTAVNGLTAGTYVFALTVTDNSGATASSQVTVTVNPAPNQSPVANAGTNQTITLPTNTVTLNGSASSDPDGTISTYSWTKVSGPATGSIAAAGSASTAVNGLTAGTYVFALIVTDNVGATASSQVTITVNPAPNQPPVANAGTNQTITLPTNTVTLNGSASSDPDGTISVYDWTKVSGPATGSIAAAGNASTAVNGLTAGTYVFALTVTDNSGATASSQVTITVNPAPNQSPVANAGTNQTITLPTNTVTLNGSASSDPDGTISVYDWTKVSGPATGSIAAAGNASTAVNGLSAGTYVFALTVTDNSGATASSQVTITVNPAPNQSPVANAGTNQTITLPTNTVTLNGSASSDPDGTISVYDWTKVSGPATGSITAAGSASTAVNGLSAGTYVFALTVTDNSGATSTSQVTVTVNAAPNQSPVANAGTNQTITLPTNTVTLNGSASSDPDGTISIYDWTKISGPATGSIAAAGSASTAVNGLSVGTYVFALTVTDNSGATSTSQVTVTVNAAPNQSPVANAGSNQTITLPTNTVTLNGSGSSDPDGTISIYDWTKISGPATGSIAATGNASTAVNGLTVGTYVFALTVTDNSGATATSQVTVTVNAAPNQSPVADAGSNQTITLPTNTATLNGSASSDPDGTISAYDWTKVSGPATGSIAATGNASTAVNGLTVGTYVFALTVTDNSGATATSQVTVTVNAAPNQSPVADAGSNQTITLPTNTATLNGSASSDPDGTISAYDWTKVSGPATGSIAAAGNASTAVSGLIAGTYVFALTVTDNSGATASSQVTITVNAAPNQSPVADAGSNQTITLPTNTVTLNGSGSSDPDGTISVYDWTKVSGPATGSIAAAGNASTAVNGLTAGTYVFALTVTDNSGATASSQVTITVNVAPNQSPVADAGTNQTIILPTNTVTLNGSGSSDPDGTIGVYDWTKISGPATGSIAAAGNASTTVDGLTAGTYVFVLTVTDNSGATASSQVTITVMPAPDLSPIANAGASQTITLPVNTATLDGSTSADPDGGIVSYSWTQISGPASASVQNAGSSQTVVSGLQQGVYTFQLTVTDNNGATATATVSVTVNAAINQPPVANAGPAQQLTLPVNTTTLDGSASTDPNGTIATYSWSQVSGPSPATIANPLAPTTGISNLTVGVYVFNLTVTDNDGAIATAQVTITVSPEPNQLPIANPGTTISVVLPQNSVVLNGTASSDPDGSIVSYNWSQISGPGSASLTNGGSASATAGSLQVGQYVFQLTVTDNAGASASAQVTVIVSAPANQSPIADPGTTITIVLPTNSATLNGSGSSDPDGSITAYSWSQVSGPSAASIATPASAVSGVSGLVEGTYVFALDVTDNNGAASGAQVTIIVQAAPNQPPVADAGADITLTIPQNSTTLNGSASSDIDGSIVSYQWVQISGPSAATMANAGTAQLSVSNLQIGPYVFELTVTDNKGAASKAQVKVAVVAPQNIDPVANAGNNQTITLPIVLLNLDGSRSFDADGTISLYTWTEVSGPSQVNISGGSTASPGLSGFVAGTYVFQLTVTDNVGATNSDQVTIVVNPAASQSPIDLAPIANAGQDITVTLPTNNASLNGSASTDPDGNLVKYEWTQVSGPSAATITDTAGAITNVNNLVEGEYVFQLTVTDNSGISSQNTVKVDVKGNEQPQLRYTSQALIYPNPAQDIVHVRLVNDYRGRASIMIFDAKGHLLITQVINKAETISDNTIDVTNLRKGIYFVQVLFDDSSQPLFGMKRVVGKLIKQ